jgi:hypothetical protein
MLLAEASAILPRNLAPVVVEHRPLLEAAG